MAITILALMNVWSHYALVVAPFGASTVLLFGHRQSPLAQPRNIVLGNAVGAAVSVACVALLGTAPWVMGLAVGLTIALGQGLRCLHPPAGGGFIAAHGAGRRLQPFEGGVGIPIPITGFDLRDLGGWLRERLPGWVCPHFSSCR